MGVSLVPATQWQLIMQLTMAGIMRAEGAEKITIVIEEGINGELGAFDSVIMSILAQNAPPGDVFEFGTYLGRTTRQLAMRRPQSTVFTIDCQDSEGRAIQRGRPSDVPFCAIPRADIGKAFRGTPEEERIIQLWGDSQHYELDEFHGSMGIVFVDGGHDYETALSDLRHARAMLADPAGGIIAAHDYGLIPDVVRAWGEVFQDAETLAFEASTVVAYGEIARNVFG